MKRCTVIMLLGLLTAFLSGSKVLAQSHEKGNVVLNGGLGFPTGVTLIDINGEYLASDNFGVGALVKFTTRSGGGTLLGAQGNYHLGQALRITNKQIDPFVGLNLNVPTERGGKLFVGGQLGLRYMFQEQFGVGAAYNLYFGDYSGFNHFGIYFTYKLGR